LRLTQTTGEPGSKSRRSTQTVTRVQIQWPASSVVLIPFFFIIIVDFLNYI
jgi:hypothetical protein